MDLETLYTTLDTVQSQYLFCCFFRQLSLSHGCVRNVKEHLMNKCET